jgi:AraC-like DNA-binding protein
MTIVADARFQEPAVADAVATRLYSWGARALYLGPALGLSPHRNAVAVLGIGLDAPFDVAIDPTNVSVGNRRCRTVLIPPNTLHHLVGTVGRFAFLYVDARSRDLDRLRSLAGEQTARAAFDLTVEDEWIACLDGLARGAVTWEAARAWLGAALAGEPAPAIDPRVRAALDRLHAEPGTRLSLGDLSRAVGLSESRFLHVFKAAIGVPLRRYKLWIAMGAAMRAIARGESLTTAALDAGFSSSAHFSSAFRSMFGLEPSRLTRAGLTTERDRKLASAMG